MKRQVRDVMQSDVDCAGQDALVSRLLCDIVNRDLGAVPVVNAMGNLVGIVTLMDVALHGVFPGPSTEELLVGDVMNRGVATIAPEASLREAVDQLREHGHLVVVDGAKVQGLVSRCEVLDGLAERLD